MDKHAKMLGKGLAYIMAWQSQISLVGRLCKQRIDGKYLCVDLTIVAYLPILTINGIPYQIQVRYLNLKTKFLLEISNSTLFQIGGKAYEYFTHKTPSKVSAKHKSS